MMFANPLSDARPDSSLRPVRAPLAALLLGAGLLLAGCQGAGGPSSSGAAPAQNLPQGFTCCNLHYTDDWISDSNYGSLPMLALGTPARVTGYGRYRVAVDMGGKPMRLGVDYGRSEPLEQYAAKYIVAEDPKRKMATYPANIQRAIAGGNLVIGMTKEQVLMSVGYPLTSENPTLNAPVWRYWLSSFEEYQVMWDANNRIKEVIGSPTVLTRVLVK